MRRTITAVATAALTLGLVAGPAAAKPDWAGPDNGNTIVGTAVALSGTPNTFDGNGGDFDILVAAVLATGADAVLNGEDEYTVFAPTDQAFLDLTGLDDEGDAVAALVDSLGVDGILSVLTYHVTEGWRPSPSVLNAKKIKMLDGNTVSGRGGVVTANNSTAGFVLTDVKTVDGGIHVIDTVLLP